MATVLIIEDNDDVREDIAEILKFEGFDVRVAENGRVGLEAIRDSRPDVVLCDIMMPELSGHAALKALRSDPAFADLPFIFVSAQADKESIEIGGELGASYYVTKPFTAEDLLDAISAVLPTSTTESDGHVRA